jgi:hypothetical protein
MSHTEMWQVAERSVYEANGIDVTTERELTQVNKLYTSASDGTSRDIQVNTGMVIRHYYLLNGHTPDVWGVELLRPIFGTDMAIILANEPSEEV